MSSTELELKLEIGEDAIGKLVRNPALRKMATGQSVERELRSTYFDTPDLLLRRERTSLRVRWDGNKWVQTLKRGTRLEHGLSKPLEIEDDLEGPDLDVSKISDPDMQSWLLELVNGAPLEPVFETIMNREINLLKVKDAGTVELAIDRGAVQISDLKEDFNEVELELKSGKAHAILSASEKLFRSGLVTPSGRSKAERGYALVSREKVKDAPEAAPHLYVRADLTSDLTSEEALKRIGKAATRQILGNWDAILTSDEPEVPHQLRIGLRRLRTALKIFRSATGNDRLHPLSKQARDMGRVVGGLRNADVLVSDIVTPAVEDIGLKKRHQALLDFLEGERLRQRSLVRASLTQADWTIMKLNCMLFEQAVDRALRGKGLKDDLLALSAGELDRTWRFVRKKGRGFANHKISQRHELRKALKELRYACDPFLPLYQDEAAKKFVRDLRRLQDVFGYLNDVAMAEELAKTIATAHPDRKDLNKSVAAVCKWHDARAKEATKKAESRWRKLVDDTKFWRPA